MQFAIFVLRWSLAGATGWCALALLAGCLGARGDIELVEARLRQQQDLADRYARDLLTAESERDAARHEANLLRTQIADAGQQAIPSELANSLFEIKSIEFNTLMTGGRDRDGQPGDDVLVAVFVPRDEHGDVVKLPGMIELEALDLNKPEAQRQVGKWTFSAEESRKLWKSGAFSSGYQVVVPLPESAGTEKVILHARLATADGREFDATHTIKLKPGDVVASQPSRGATGSASAAPPAASPPLAPPATEPPVEQPGRARVTPVVHEETQPVSTTRAPRPTPLANEPASPLVPVPADDAFTPPPEDAGNPFSGDGSNPFADPPGGNPAAESAPAGATTVNKPATVENPEQSDDQPRPFPGGLKTSDNWTDETIPFLR